ncbi:MAG: GMC family oxidoreductase [Actinomycetota bacterium]|nr:GMC family oxidoreductase [Actinomycetota bacterium]
MSALSDLSAVLLPPEKGGPDPRRVAAAARILLNEMPARQRIGVAAGLAALEAGALTTSGRTLGNLPSDRRTRFLERIAGSGPIGSAAVDALKTLVLLAAGGDEFAPEIRTTGSLYQLSHPDPALKMRHPNDLGDRESFDAIVVGSGAGGAWAALELARAGLDVLIVEEGERWTSGRIRTTHPLERFASLYRDAGTTMALGLPPIALPIGRAVGGTTVVNSGTCYRPPPAVVDVWRGAGLELAGNGFDERLTEVERMLGVAPVPTEVMGRNGELALAGAAALGWEAGPLLRNAPGCRGSCQCAIGCPNNAKSGVHMNALPAACELGAEIASSLRVKRVLTENGRATGVEAIRPNGSRVKLRASRIIVSAGAIETPPLLRRSNLGRHPRLGRGLSIHPAISASARFEEPVTAWQGVLQSAGVDELHVERGILIEATSTPPGMGSMLTPGIGAELVERVKGASHRAAIGAMIADAPSGRVFGSGSPIIGYRLARHDGSRLIEALDAMARIMLAAGAEEVELGSGTPPIRSNDEIGPALAGLEPKSLHLAAFHPTGTAGAGGDSKRHPVGPRGALRGVEGVWVADGSILPGCPGVNPQVSIMALSGAVGEAAAVT